MSKRPEICEKRGCYIQPKITHPEWNKLNIRCDDCPYFDEEKERKEFEKWYEADAMPLEHPNWFRKDSDGDYEFDFVNHAWHGWAGRAGHIR